MSEFYVYYGKSNTKYPATQCTCITCGKQFLVGTRWLADYKVLACSAACRKIYYAKINVEKALNEQTVWSSKEHYCERCGKLMLKKFGSGRFCSRACANLREHSEETKQKIAKAITGTTKVYKNRSAKINRSELFKIKYAQSPKTCTVCGAVLPFEGRKRKTCSETCRRALIGQVTARSAEKHGGNNNISGVRGTAKYGTYKGYVCDSSYELAFVIYCLDHNIPIQRNHTGFCYTYKDETHNYFPDFIINNDTYVEIKGYTTDLDKAKWDYFPSDVKFELIDKAKITPYITYCKQTYGDFVQLYDLNCPSWKDRLNKLGN